MSRTAAKLLVCAATVQRSIRRCSNPLRLVRLSWNSSLIPVDFRQTNAFPAAAPSALGLVDLLQIQLVGHFPTVPGDDQ
eukprot:m.173177 g.173177  ORF g.173177 m.173177 type:complete len:79 (-) comp14583_c0_seq7:16969-17205(-)